MIPPPWFLLLAILISLLWILAMNACGAHLGLYDGPFDGGKDERRSSRRDFDQALPFVMGITLVFTALVMRLGP